MKVKKITVKNLKSIWEMTADFNWCTAIVTGGNNKWKSTFLKSFIDRMRWEKIFNIVKNWEDSWFCEYELTDWSKFIWETNWDSEKLSYITKDWIKIKTGIIKELSKRFFWEWFDIDEFLQSQPKKQKEQLQKILWIDLTKLEEEYNLLYNERTEKNTIYKTEKAKSEWLCVVSDIKEKIDLSKLRDKLLDVEKKNQNYNHISNWISEKESTIIDIENQIKALQDKKDILLVDINKWKDWIKNNKKEDVELLKQEILEAEKNNELVDNNEYIKKQLENVEITRKDWEEVNNKIKQIEDKMFSIIKSAKIPEWFEFKQDWLLYNWFELDKKQLSSSSIYIASLKLASMWLWEIKTLCFDASYLDKNSLKEIEDWANRNDLQLLIERPDYDWWELKYEILS